MPYATTNTGITHGNKGRRHTPAHRAAITVSRRVNRATKAANQRVDRVQARLQQHGFDLTDDVARRYAVSIIAILGDLVR
jgi:hypothetical protein